jgi:hypothetical protein
MQIKDLGQHCLSQFPLFAQRRLWAAPLVTASLALLSACGGQSVLLKEVRRESLTYDATCKTAAAKQSERLMSGEYNPAQLFVHTWPQATAPTELILHENRLVEAMAAGQLKSVLITARGGLGKTSLVESLRAQMCAATPVFAVDLKDIAALAEPSAHSITVKIAESVGAKTPEALADLKAAMAAAPFVVFLDSIEETDLARRGAAVQAVRGLATQYPAATLILTARAPVLEADYGLEFDTRLEIPPLECRVSEAMIARQFKDEEQRRRFTALLKRYGLDEKSKFGAQCAYPYLSTYRDINTLAEFFRKTASGEVLVSFSSVYETLIGMRLKKEFDNLRWTQADALDMGDRLVRSAIAKLGRVSLMFNLPLCESATDPRWGEAAVDAGVAGTPQLRKRHVCEKTLQSALFIRAEGSGGYAFADRGTLDLFLARWLNGEVARAGGSDCTVLDQHKDVLASPGVVKFFVGQALGRRCVAQTIAQYCARQADANGASTIASAVELGLPIGKARSQILQEARAAGSALQPLACINQVLDDLDRTVTE